MVAVRMSCGWSRCLLTAVFCFAAMSSSNVPKFVSADEPSEEEAEQIKAAERFLTVLEKSPRRGTALDRVYGHHVEFGTLDKFIAGLKEKTAADPMDGTSWILLGLMEAQRGQDGNAADAFKQAEATRATDPLTSYYLAQSLLRIGQNEEAIAAFERAIARKPQRNDLLEISQQLGRVHQRAQRTQEAMKVWQQLESLFPDDARVLEQIAVTLAEEGDIAEAQLRYERLAKLVKDDYRRTMCLIEVAELKIKGTRKDEGIADLEKVMAELDPDSWLYKDVRRRIDDVFLRSSDQDNLVKYYQKWLETHPEDVEGMARLARFLAQSARVPEATQWMEKALKLAPSRTDLRKSFIDQLVDDQRIPEAIKQYEQLVAAAPGNPDFLRDWGKLVLRDKSQDLEVRKKEAVRIWNQIVSSRPDDAITTAQVADLFRQANLIDDAQKLYEKAVTLAPADPQYREYLGEFYHIQKKTDDALKTWAAMAEGEQRTAENVARLAEVYNSFGYLDQAVKEIGDACKLAPKEFALQMRAAEYHMRATKYDEALTFLSAAQALAANDDERDSLIRQRIEIFQSSQKLEEEIAKLEESVKANSAATPADWAMLARYYEANRQWVEATESIEKGLAIDPKSAPTLTVAARISESSGNFGQAAEYSRRLADSDRRSRGDHLMNVARLEAQMGRSEQALAAANELIVSAPGNTDNYEFLAQMCFRLGKADEGLEALRKAVRINPNEPHLIMALGAALADQLRTDEAIAVYWRAFEKSETIDDKTNLTQKLVPLYEQINQMDKLIERFERDRREEEKRREMTICLAQAWQTSGDFGTARTELEQLLGEDSRDTNLLQQLSKLCESSGDLEAAIGYQRQLIAVAPGHETEFPLVAMLQSRGDRDEAMEILVKLTAREDDPARLLKSIDSLLNQGAYEAVIRITEPLLSQQREDWELLYREGVAWSKLDKRDEAKTRFDRILALTIPHDTLGLFATDEFKRAQAKAKSENLKGNKSQSPTKRSPLQLLNNSSEVQRATGMRSEDYYSSSSSRPQLWTPREYGTARMASLAWLMNFEDAATTATDAASTVANTEPKTNTPAPKAKTVLESVAEKAQVDGANRNAIYDWLYAVTLRGERATAFQIARDLAKSGGKEEQQYFLNSLRTRHVNQNNVARSSNEDPNAGKTPLSEDDMVLMLKCVEDLSKDTDKNSNEAAAAIGGQVAYDDEGNAYVMVGNSWVMMGSAGGKHFTMQIIEELKLAKRDAEAETRLNELYASAKTAAELAGVLGVMLQQEKFELMPEYFQRWHLAAKEELAKPAPASPNGIMQPRRIFSGLMNTMNRWIGKLAADEENAQILSLLNQMLDIGIIENKERRIALAAQAAKSRRRTPLSVGQNQLNFNWYYGKQNDYVQVTLPAQSLDSQYATLLRQVHEVCKRNEVLPDLIACLNDRAQAASPEDAPFVNLLLATELWWADEQDEAVEILVGLGESQKDDPNTRFELANLRMQRGDIEDALEIVDSIVARDQQLLQRRELMALTLAERLGDNERARAAAERLFGLRLDSATQLSLVDGMRRLGMTDMADAVVARTERQASNQPASLASLMMLYKSQGKADKAKQLAHMLLRKTVSPITTMANAARNPNRYSRSEDSSRPQALALLQQTGELKTLIAQLEAQLERSPESAKLYEQLIEFYGITGQKDKVAPLLEKAIAVRPESHGLRLQLAKHYEQSQKPKQACDQYLELLKRKPDWVTDELYSIRRIFQQAERSEELVAAIRGMNFKSITQPSYIISIASELMRDDKNTDVAIELLERVMVAFPNYRSNILSYIDNSGNGKIWQNERLFQIGKQIVIPTALDLKSRPWAGLDQIYSRSGNGDVSSHFHYMIRGIGKSDRLLELRKTIEEKVQTTPNWYGGESMLALIDLQSDLKDEAKKRLEALASNETAMKSIPSDSCWMIGQELDRFEETRPLAVMLFEKAMSTNSTNSSSSQLQYSPVQKLIKAFTTNGRKTEAREILLKTVKTATFNQYDAQYASYQRTENSLFAATKLLEMQYPVDAVQLYRQLLDDENTLRTAAQWNGNEAEQYVNQAKTGLSKAMGSLDSAGAADAITQLLVINDAPKEGVARLDLMPVIPSISNIGSESIDSGMVKLLVTLAKDEKVRTAIDARLTTLQTEHPSDLSIAIVLAAFRAQMKDPKFAESVQVLEKLVVEQPLDVIAEGRRPNSRQRKVAAMSVPLWIVAREAFKQENLRPQAAILAERAAAAARRQTGLQSTSSILIEWSQALLANGNKAEAEAKLTELLRISTERPKRKSKDEVKPVGAIWKERSVFPGDSFLAWSVMRRAGDVSSLTIPRPHHQGIEIPRPPETSIHPATGIVRNALAFGLIGLGRQPSSLTSATLLPVQQAARPAANPQPQRPAQDPTAAPQGDTVPPLTISQFRLAMKVAEMAAKNGMASLSRTAVKEAMSGGTPVPDPVETPVNNNGRGITRVMNGVVVRSQGDSTSGQFDTELVASLKNVLEKWTGNDYPADEVYDLLKPLVLPPSRPGNVMLYPDNSLLRNAQATSLAARFVGWAAKANKLTDISQTLQSESYKNSPAGTVPVLVLQTLVDLEAKSTVDAMTHLKELSEVLRKAPNPSMMQLACHAALPASEQKELEEPAYEILKQAVMSPWSRTVSAGTDTSQIGETGKLDEQVNRYLARSGDVESVRKYFDSQQVAKQAVYSRYSGDSALNRQWKDLAGFASEAARIGMPTIAMEFMGKATDIDVKRYSPPEMSMPLAVVVRHLSTLSPQQRYDAWRDWTMPVADRQTVRFIAQGVRSRSAFDPFLEITPQPGTLPDGDLLCNLTEMIRAAKECGALDELHALAVTAASEKLPNSEYLLPLVLIAKEDVAAGVPAVHQLIDSMMDRRKDQGNRPPFGDVVVVRECLRTPAFADTILMDRRTKLQSSLRQLNATNFLPAIEVEQFRQLAERAGSSLRSGNDVGLTHWFPVSPVSTTFSNTPHLWMPYENTVTHFAGKSTDLLYFAYPVEGDFEFSVDCMEKHWGGCDAGYGGTIVRSDIGSIMSVTGDDAISRPTSGRSRGVSSFNRISVRSANGRMQYVVNGRMVYEEAAHSTSPWITLFTTQDKIATFRNPRITGNAVIPREVKLLSDNGMEGWSCSDFGDRRPSPRLMAEKVTDEESYVAYEQKRQPADFDWSVKESVLTGLRRPEATADRQSRIYYCRPLQTGETMRYEFYYEPGQIVAHPAIGRFAMLLEPDGVKSHWMSQPGWDDTFSGIPLDNSIVESQFQKGQKELPLKSGDWNSVDLSLKDGTVTVLLNGAIVFERPLPKEFDTHPGMFRYQRQESRIRNVVLTGPWPELNDALKADLLGLKSPQTPADRRLIESMIPETVFELQVPQLLADTSILSAEEGYARLKQWVLPSEDHSLYRMFYRTVAIEPNSDPSIRSASDLQSPALELVHLARQLNRVDELAKEVEALAVSSELETRNQQAMLALLAMQGSDPQSAREKIAAVATTLMAGLPQSLTAQQRAAELLVTWEAMQHPEMLPLAVELATKLRDNERDEKLRSNDDRFHKLTHGLIGRLDLVSRTALAAGEADASDASKLTQWASVQYVKPEHRYRGQHASHWSFKRGEVNHHPAETWSQLFFQSPLKGKFEILVNRSTFGYKEVAVSWGMHSAEPRYDLKAVKVVRLMHASNDIEKAVTLPAWEAMAEFRIVVDGSKVTTFTNGVQFHEENLTGSPSPWIALQTHNSTDEATIRNLRIVGTPEIPEQIDLIDMSGWNCWRADTYSEWHNATTNDETTPWQKVGDELVGKLKNGVAGATESLMLYQRPMLEDGEIEFETFYVPGEQEVHPAVGQSAILLRPDGAQLHTLTNAQFETRDLAVDNATAIAGAAKIELKPNDWNKVKLTLKGDQLTVAVNGTDVATHTVTERRNERFFGLFRYSNLTQCRVRNLVYRGDWPKTLPALESQELATGQ